MTNPSHDALNAAHPDGTITVRETPMQAGLRAVRENPDHLTIEEHLRTELQGAHDKIDVLKHAAARYLKAGDAYLDERLLADDFSLMAEFSESEEVLRLLVQP